MSEETEIELSTEDKAAQIGKEVGASHDNEPDYEVVEENDDSDDRLAKTREEQRTGQKPDRKELSNREKRKLRKQRTNQRFEAKDALIESLLSANNELEQRLGAVENKTMQHDRAQVEKDYKDAQDAFKRAEKLHSEAFQEGDGTKATQAMREMYLAQRKIDDIEAMVARKPAEQQQQTRKPQRAVPPIPKAVEWANRNKWFNPMGPDQDSQIANTIASAIANEGYDPNSDDFYDELDDRLKKYMPDKIKAQDEDEEEEYEGEDDADTRQRQTKTKRKSPPVSGGGSSRSDTGGKTRVTLPTAYINALKEAGKWEDPIVRNRMIKRYQEGQRQNAGR